MLSKSKVIRGINCSKSLWLYIHKRNERRIEDITQFVFKQGIDVGEIARQYFPGGELAVYDYPNFESANRTKHFIDVGIETIYEATFIYNKTIIAADILTKIDGKWQLFEFKSTNSIKDQHISDVAIQYHVITGCGIPIEDVSVLFMNRNYLRKGKLDIKNLFIYQSVLKEAVEIQPFVDYNIKTLQQIEKQTTEPQIKMGTQCTTPYKCDFYDYCNNLSPLKKIEILEEHGNETKINHEELKLFLKKCSYPLYFLGFKTIMPCIPMFDNSRPYQQIPFQYSLHYKTFKTSELIQYSYLANTDSDPRIELIKNLIYDTQKEGFMMVYNKDLEINRLLDLQRDFPEYADAIEKIMERLIGLMPVLSKQFCIAKSINDCFSINKLLPVICPELMNSDLEINSETDAASSFLSLFEEKDLDKINKRRYALLKYVEMETYAMVKIFEALENTIS